MTQPPVTCQFERHKGFRLNLGKREGSRQALDDWPSKLIETRRFFLSPATGSHQSGRLAAESAKDMPRQTISSALGTSKSTAGLPFISSTINAHLNKPLRLDIAKINRKLAVVYQSDTFLQPALILGAPELSLRIESSRPQFQLIAYLYEATAEGRCRLITHGPITRHSVMPNKPLEVNFELVTTCYDVQEGHHLVLVIDTSDLQYKMPTKDEFEVTFHYAGSLQPTLDVPFAEADL
jgi:predicted acyl esterase